MTKFLSSVPGSFGEGTSFSLATACGVLEEPIDLISLIFLEFIDMEDFP